MLSAEAYGNQQLRKPEKIYLNNTTLAAVISKLSDKSYSVGSQRELFFLQMLQNAKISVSYPKITDFLAKDIYFEIGGKNKTLQQKKSITATKFLVKDDILTSHQHTIPLYYIGFLY